VKKTPAARLRTYRAKRDFSLTPEPSPESAAPRASGSLRFMIHKHDATRLHYDVRLEIDGVLASWAVPKGPSFNPSDKRLAVETEDHPLAYATFEGRIPEGAYGAGDSLIWDTGTYETVPPGQESAQRKKGHLTVEFHGQKLQGRWHLLRTRAQGCKAQWLMFKSRDEYASDTYDVTVERPESVKSGRAQTRGPERRRARTSPKPSAKPSAKPGRKTSRATSPDALLEKVWPPMLARLSTPEEAAEAPHVFEVKYDGFRALAAISGGKVRMQSRNAIDLAPRFPALVQALTKLKVREAVLDAEVVALDPKGRSRFQLLQNAREDASVEQRFVAFDLLWLDGEDLRDRPLEERRELLERVMAGVQLPLQLAERIDLPQDKALAEARRRGWEGLIAKRLGSTYTGSRSSDWLKLKVLAGQEVALLGYLPITNGKPQIGSLILGVHAPDGFHEVGKVGTGFDTKTRTRLKQLLDKDRVRAPAAPDARPWKDAVWVKPRLVANVNFTEWTEDGRLRHPVFQGLRDDKSPEEVVRERPSTQVRKTRAAAAEARGTRRVSRSLAARTAAAPVTSTTDELLTHPERVLYPDDGLTKADVFEYYRSVAPVLLPVLRDRPLALQRWPAGIHAPGFFRQGNPDLPDWAPTMRIQHLGKVLPHVNVVSEEVLLLLANRSALTLHMWSSHRPRLDSPDWVVFDLDPGKGGWDSVITVALALREHLEELGLESVPKTSGKRGLHVLVPVARGLTYERTQAFADAVVGLLEQELGDIATTERSIAKRGGRLYLDAGQNARGKTVVAPYSLRGVDGAPFSAPLEWSEVTRKLDPKSFNLRTLARRLDAVGDLFAPALSSQQKLPKL
jgi:bifunctional non-homologous end joining protein LigD